MGRPWERRPVAAHRFGIEVELVCADDMGTGALAHALTQLSTAGLHGMVARIRSVVLDGIEYEANDALVDFDVRPPPDPKLDAVLREAERLVASLRTMASRQDRSIEAVA